MSVLSNEELTEDEIHTILYIIDEYFEIRGAIKTYGLEHLVDKSPLLRMTIQKEEEYVALKGALMEALKI
tara:strand:- start:271 stop:480 length:210 start_codon:yes stop_codon:yes gene_type:complete